MYHITPTPGDSHTIHFTSTSGFTGDFVMYSKDNTNTPIITCSMSAATPLTALATLTNGSYVIVLRTADIQKTPFTLTVASEADSQQFSFNTLPAAFAVSISTQGLSEDPVIVSLLQWTTENGRFTLRTPEYNTVFRSTGNVTVWTPVLFDEVTLYTLSNTRGNAILLLGNNVYEWSEDVEFRFHVNASRELVLYPCPAGYSAVELLYEASNVGGGIFTFGQTGEGPQQFTPRLSKKTYYGGCFINGYYTLAFEHSAGDEAVTMLNQGSVNGRYDNDPSNHEHDVTVNHARVVPVSCNDDETEVSFESSLHCLIDEYGADNEFALTASPLPFVICMKNAALLRIRALSFEGGHLRVAMNGVTADYELSNFGEGWLKVGTGAVAPPEGYTGYYELTNAVSELPIPEGVQTLFVNWLNGTEYREFDLADYPLLQFFAVLGNETAIGVKAKGHANLRLVNVTNEEPRSHDSSVFRVTDCPQLAAIHLHWVEAASFTLGCTPLLLPSP